MKIERWENILLLCEKITYEKKELKILELGRKLFNTIDKYELTYGKNSESLATRADYYLIIAPYYSLRLLKDAYKIAQFKKDFEELVFISSSIASIYIENLGLKKRGVLWVQRLEKYLKKSPNKVENDNLVSLKKKWKKLHA